MTVIAFIVVWLLIVVPYAFICLFKVKKTDRDKAFHYTMTDMISDPKDVEKETIAVIVKIRALSFILWFIGTLIFLLSAGKLLP